MLRKLLAVVALSAASLSACAQPMTVEDAERGLAYGMAQGETPGIASFYSPLAVVRRDYQPAFCGSAVEDYYEALAARRTNGSYASEVTERFELGEDTLVFGRFMATGLMADGADFAEEGRFARLWSPGPDKRLYVIAEVIGHPVAPGDPGTYAVPGLEAGCGWALDGAAPLAAEMADSNARMAKAVQDKDAEGQIAFYADDAVFMPFGAPDAAGIEAIATHLRTYVDAGSGAVFERVLVWNDGYIDYGGYVLELARFQVDWRYEEATGTATGGGLRLWRREVDGTLMLLRQIGTHDG